MHFRRLLSTLGFAFTALLIASPAVAENYVQEVPSSAQRAAQYYADAAEAYQEGDFARAAELLERAFAHEQDLVYKYNEVLANVGMENYEHALRILDIYGDPMRADDRFDDIDDLQEELQELLAIQEEEARQAALAKERAGIEELEPPAASGGSSEIIAWSLIAGGGASLLAGGLFSSGILISDAIDRLEDSRTPEGLEAHYGENSPHDRDQDLKTLSTHQSLAIATLGGGLVLGGAGVALLIFGAHNNDEEQTSSAFNLRVEPHLSSRFAGAILRGQF